MTNDYETERLMQKSKEQGLTQAEKLELFLRLNSKEDKKDGTRAKRDTHNAPSGT